MIPYKSWSRALFGSEGFNLGDIVLIAISAPFVITIVRERRRNSLYFWILAIWIVTLISFLKGVLTGEDLREMSRVIRACIFWSIVPMMVNLIRSESSVHRWLRGMAVVLAFASFTIVAFSLDQSLIPKDDEVGTPRYEVFGGLNRSFTLGMWGVFAGATVGAGSVILNKRRRLFSALILSTFLFGLLFTFVRTFFLLLLLSAVVYGVKSWRLAIRTVVLPLGLVFLLVAAFGMPKIISNAVDAAGERIVALAQSDFSEVDPTDQEGLGTLIWRVAEIDAGLEQFRSLGDQLFGVLGRTYELGDYTSSMPHISYFAILYSHGIVGLVVYLGFIGVVSLRLLRNWKRMRGERLEWIGFAAFVCWLSLLAGAFLAPLFMFPYGVVTMAFVIGVSESTGTNVMKRNQDNNGIAKNLHRNS